MKRFSSILILLSVLLQVFSGTIIFATFKVNQRFIASTLCENKAKPMMHCNGHCHLKKQLDQNDQKEKNIPMGSVKDKTELVYFYEPVDQKIFSLTEIRNNYFSFAEPVTFGYMTPVFHPPSC